MIIKTNGNLNDSGKLTAEVTLDFNGINDTAYRGLFSQLTPDERKLFFEKVLRGILPSAKLTQLTISPANMHDTSKTTFSHFDVRGKKYTYKIFENSEFGTRDSGFGTNNQQQSTNNNQPNPQSQIRPPSPSLAGQNNRYD